MADSDISAATPYQYGAGLQDWLNGRSPDDIATAIGPNGRVVLPQGAYDALRQQQQAASYFAKPYTDAARVGYNYATTGSSGMSPAEEQNFFWNEAVPTGASSLIPGVGSVAERFLARPAMEEASYLASRLPQSMPQAAARPSAQIIPFPQRSASSTPSAQGISRQFQDLASDINDPEFRGLVRELRGRESGIPRTQPDPYMAAMAQQKGWETPVSYDPDKRYLRYDNDKMKWLYRDPSGPPPRLQSETLWASEPKPIYPQTDESALDNLVDARAISRLGQDRPDLFLNDGRFNAQHPEVKDAWNSAREQEHGRLTYDPASDRFGMPYNRARMHWDMPAYIEDSTDNDNLSRPEILDSYYRKFAKPSAVGLAAGKFASGMTEMDRAVDRADNSTRNWQP